MGIVRRMVSRVIYWIKECIRGKKNCRGFCPTCEYYGICKEDEGETCEAGEVGIYKGTRNRQTGLQVYDHRDNPGYGTYRFVGIEEEKAMDSKMLELEDYLKLERILLEEETRRELFVKEIFEKTKKFEKGEAA